MTPSEIITKDSQRLGLDPQMVLGKISRVIKSGAGILLKEGDSLLLVIAMPDNNAELHIYTADSPLNIGKSVKKFVQKIRASDLNNVYGSGEIPQMLKMLNKFGVHTEPSNLPNYRWMAKV